ncbi:MAG: DUF2760 domain-containing protein, partial [Rhodoplanes sp.]
MNRPLSALSLGDHILRRSLAPNDDPSFFRLFGGWERPEGKSPKAMRKLVVALAVILLALSALALAPGVVPTPYADILPKVIAGAAVLLLIAILADRSKAESAGPAAKAAAPVAAAPLANQADSEVVNFLAILQERGRFVDFLMDDITPYSDAQVGAAGRVLHEG